MKKILIVSLFLTFSFSLFAQKSVKFNGELKKMGLKLKKSSEVSAKFKALLGPVILSADDDCTPPPCSGIIDPWTCECTPDIKDPWEDEKIASKLKAVQRFEAGLSRGEGKSIIMIGEYKAAQKRFPGNSLKAIVNRLNYYAEAAK